jgi:hypothetical protein
MSRNGMRGKRSGTADFSLAIVRRSSSRYSAGAPDIRDRRRLLAAFWATVRWHPIMVETAAAGMLRGHEQHRELGINFDR